MHSGGPGHSQGNVSWSACHTCLLTNLMGAYDACGLIPILGCRRTSKKPVYRQNTVKHDAIGQVRQTGGCGGMWNSCKHETGPAGVFEKYSAHRSTDPWKGHFHRRYVSNPQGF